MEDNEEIIYWDDTFHDCLYNNVKHPKMLDKDGLILSLKCRLAGKESRSSNGSLRKVKFDKSYLLHYLKRQVWEAFNLFSEDEILDLIKQARNFDKDDPINGAKIYKLHGHEVVRINDLARRDE